MFEQFLNWWSFNFWLGLVSLITGLVIVSPFLLSKNFRRRILRSDFDIEAIGIVALVVAVIAIGCYNYFGAGSGA